VAGALAGDGWNLVAKALAAPGGHQHQRVAAGGDMVNDAGLRPAEGRVAEDLAKDGRRGEVESYQKRSC